MHWFHLVASFLVLFFGATVVNILSTLDYFMEIDLRAKIIENGVGQRDAAAENQTKIFQSDRYNARIAGTEASYYNTDARIADTEASYYNTENGNSTDKLCNRQEIIDGSWVPTQLSRPPYVPRNAQLRCYPDHTYTSGVWDTHRWEPNSDCELTNWKDSDFCSLMQRATVLIIGDSLSWEHYSSLGQLLGLRVHQSSQFKSKNDERNHVQYACRHKMRLVFRRDDILSDVTSAIQETFPQVIVMNRGAHYQNDTKFLAGLEKNVEELKAWQMRCQAQNIKCHAFWRTSVPGHPLCSQANFTSPSNSRQDMAAWIADPSHYDNHTIKYRWYNYQHQNELAVETLRKGLGKDAFQVLDAYHLNILRPDEHRAHQGDCLHNCYPGKMDVYSRLLLHFLLQQRSQHDVDELVQLFDRLAPHIEPQQITNTTVQVSS